MSKSLENRVLSYMSNSTTSESATSIMFEAPRPYVRVVTDSVANRYLSALLGLVESGLVIEDESGRFLLASN